MTSGAATSWHDLVLHLIGCAVGPVAAQVVSKVFALQRHVDALAPFTMFDPTLDVVERRVTGGGAEAPGEAAVGEAGLPNGLAHRRRDRGMGVDPVLRGGHERVAVVVGRRGPRSRPAFRRLFRKIAGVTPGKYRRQFAQPLA